MNRSSIAITGILLLCVGIPMHARAMQTETRIVKRGDTLSAIALQECGNARRFPEIATASGIKNPNLIIPDQKLIIPCAMHTAKIRNGERKTPARVILASSVILPTIHQPVVLAETNVRVAPPDALSVPLAPAKDEAAIIAGLMVGTSTTLMPPLSSTAKTAENRRIARKNYEVRAVVPGGQVVGMQAGNFPALLLREHGAMVSTTGPNSGRVTATVQPDGRGNYIIDAVLREKPSAGTEIAIDFNGNIGGIGPKDVATGFASEKPVYATMDNKTYNRFKALLPMRPSFIASVARFILPFGIRSASAFAMAGPIGLATVPLGIASGIAQQKFGAHPEQVSPPAVQALEQQIQDLQKQVDAIKSATPHPGGMDHKENP